jgi:hypothetical protein
MTANTPRKRMSQKRRQAIFTEHATAHNIAPCCICGRPVHRWNDRWIVEHIRALGLLGRDVNTNCGPAHYECAQAKTHTEDLPRIAKAKRQAVAGTRKGWWKPEGAVYDWSARRYRLTLAYGTTGAPFTQTPQDRN